jgi:hypothetical protein
LEKINKIIVIINQQLAWDKAWGKLWYTKNTCDIFFHGKNYWIFNYNHLQCALPWKYSWIFTPLGFLWHLLAQIILCLYLKQNVVYYVNFENLVLFCEFLFIIVLGILCNINQGSYNISYLNYPLHHSLLPSFLPLLE